MDVRSLYDRLSREPQDYPLFERVWQVVTFAPSFRQMDEEELVSLAGDAFDYLQADGKWKNQTAHGMTELSYDGRQLKVTETAQPGDFEYHHTFTVRH